MTISPFLFLGILLIGANALFNSLASALGLQYPYTTFLFNPSDVFADFIKTALAFPGPQLDISHWHHVFQTYLLDNVYTNFAISGKLSNLHGMPIPTIVAIISRRLFVIINPLYLWVLVGGLLMSALLYVVHRIIRVYYGARNGLLYACYFLISYPLLFSITRGHAVSMALSVILIVFFSCILSSECNILLPSLLLALAVNLRPNTIVFILAPIAMYSLRRYARFFCLSISIATSLYLVSLQFAHYLLPNYTLLNFLEGLRLYQNQYISQNWGVAFGSGFLTSAKFIRDLFHLNIPVTTLYSLNLFSFIFLIFTWLFCSYKRLADMPTCLASLFCIYAFSSGIFADYYLIPLVFLFCYIDNIYAMQPSSNRAVQLLMLMLAISPKQYLFISGISLQVIINPILLLIAALSVHPELSKIFARTIWVPSTRMAAKLFVPT